MSEDQAPYNDRGYAVSVEFTMKGELTKPDPPQFFPSAPLKHHYSGDVTISKGDFLVASIESDPFGAKAVWKSHYDLAIETMHPISAVEAANAAALAYAKGNHYISMGGKGDAAEYRMIPKEVGR